MTRYFRSAPASGLADAARLALEKSWQGEKPLAALRPLGALYGWGAALRRGLRARFFPAGRAALPVVSIGNLTVGGSGKTPMCLAVAELLLGAGFRPAVLSRGYGRRKTPGQSGPLVVSKGEGPLAAPAESGDEPWLMASRLPGLIVVVDADRLRGAAAAKDCGADFLILDDGFQQMRLAADCRVLLVPAEKPFGNQAVLPAGPLREPLKFHRLADILVTTGADEPSGAALALALNRPLFAAPYRAVGWRGPGGGMDLKPLNFLAGRKVAAFCGLARPAGFERGLAALKLDLRRFTVLADHQAYDHGVLAELTRGFLEAGADCLVTTAKDAVKIPPDFPIEVFSLEMKMELNHPAEFLQALMSLTRRGDAPPQFSGGLNASAENGHDSLITLDSFSQA
ncbi:tetraacyldisaccharide 4'-kinase [Deltaproteobacteria bacterium OttesenSCG-928-K17]|nr:tetraacyldisaccharide 4'-kinase [Deltaproteobacteria bacterium OttesenSCG-928-K17]